MGKDTVMTQRQSWESDVLEWHMKCEKWLSFSDGVASAMHLDCESPLVSIPWEVMSGWADLIQRTHGLDNWLDHWLMECLGNANPVHSKVLCRGKEYRLRTIEDLLKVIAADKGIEDCA